MKVIVLCLLLLGGCSIETQSRTLESRVEAIIYFKDKRTNLCFAKYDRGITNVPCENAEKLLPKGEE